MKRAKLLIGSVAVITMLSFGLCGCGGSGDTTAEDPAETADAVAAETTTTTTEAPLVEEEMPENEHIFVNKFDSRPSKVEVNNPTDTAYYMKFEDKDGETVFAFFVRPQSTAPMYMGTGTYTLKFAAGTTWYGEENLFGPSTVYSMDKEDWVFESGKGWTLTMEKQINGNVATESLDEDEF